MTERKMIYLDDAMLKIAKVDKNKYADMSDFHDACVDCLKNLPSAQPEHDCVLTMWGECSYNETGCSDCAIKAKITKALICNESDDLVSRQVAIDAVEESRRLNHHQDGKEACAHEYEHRHFLKILRDLPPVQPERKTGEWVGAVEYCKRLEEATGERYQPSGLAGMIYCNQCWTASDRKSNYCRSCGADMMGEEV